MDISWTDFSKLEERNTYIVLLDIDNDTAMRSSDDEELYYLQNELSMIRIEKKFENSIIIRILKTNEERVYTLERSILLYDHVPETYIRKKKLDKINKNG